jgi:hypothetical protein
MGDHVLSSTDSAKKGVVVVDNGTGAMGPAAYLVMRGDGKQFGWLDLADIVLDVEHKLEDQLKELEELKASFLSGSDVLSADLATPEKMSWLNIDSNYKQSMCEVIDVKNHCLSKLVKHLSKLDEG